MAEQLPLNLQLTPRLNFTNFFVGDNSELLNYLPNWIVNNSKEQFIYLWGQPGAGKSHLLQACCQLAENNNLTSAYLPLSQLKNTSPEIFSDLEHLDFIAIDDINLINQSNLFQENLMYLYNRVRDNQKTKMLLSGNVIPNQMGLSLKDLSSRLSWGLVFEVKLLSDSGKIEVLVQHAKSRGLNLSIDSAQYILNHTSRNVTDLIEFLDKLDKRSLQEKRALTIPFIKKYL